MLKSRINFFVLFMTLCVSFASTIISKPVYAKSLPFYSHGPYDFCERATFSTFYGSSKEERKWNIALASKAINNFLLDAGAEFSFNRTVGDRTEQRGYKQAKIIVNGEFVDGVGGGVCQVSTTLYNAVILAGLKITEYHPHTLSVSYVSPSLDAMVNSGTSDLRFVNDTDFPIIIKAVTNGEVLKISISGKKSKYRYKVLSEIIEEIPAEYKKMIDDGKYPNLCVGEEKILTYAKNGIKSRAYLIKYKGDKVLQKRIIRIDYYKPLSGLIVIGAGKEIEEESGETLIQKDLEESLAF